MSSKAGIGSNREVFLEQRRYFLAPLRAGGKQ